MLEGVTPPASLERDRMKFIDEYRNPLTVRTLADDIRKRIRRPLKLMEFCGGHTHAIMRFGIRELLPQDLQMLAGPGCPVCVTSSTDVDRAIAMARIEGVIWATFGDMVRVPGSQGNLEDARGQGADVRIVYSPMDALAMATKMSDRPVIFLGVGFETTAPAVAASILQAREQGVRNYFVLSLHKLTPPAMRAILDGGEVSISGILGPGHVTTVIGTGAWTSLSEKWKIPVAVAGFEPVDILLGIRMLVDQVNEGQARVDNAYPRSVLPQGNRTALAVMDEVFEACDAEWRGFGILPASGLGIRDKYAAFDASRMFPVSVAEGRDPSGCHCGEVLRGVASPITCPLFGRACGPDHPVGPCMVSSEGACRAYYQFGDRHCED
ncbi:MAG: hypD [Deltaproteobacteria bacterium]|nr:hypD [Deltaproteobacteria bacterium]